MSAIELTNENFQTTIDSNKIVLVDFFAPWCGHCRMFLPIFKKVAELHPDVVFGTLCTPDFKDVARENKIVGIPTVLGFRNGQEVYRKSGVLSEEDFESAISDLVNGPDVTPH